VHVDKTSHRIRSVIRVRRTGAGRVTTQTDIAAQPLPSCACVADATAEHERPDGRKWGQVIRVHVAPNGNIWVFHRCFNDKPNGDATCINRGDANPPLLEFNPAGKLLHSIGVGLFANPHGFTIDKDGNLWTSDTNDKDTIFDMSARDAAGKLIGQQVFKLSPLAKF